MASSLTGVYEVDQSAYYSDDLLVDDAIFNVAAAAVLAFAGDTSVSSSTFNGPGATRVLGKATLAGVDIAENATFANEGAVVQSGSVTEASSLVRNIGDWSLGAGAAIVGADASAKFVNLGVFDAVGPAAETNLISASFYDFGELNFSGTLAFLGDQTLINVGGLPLGATGAGTGVIGVAGGVARFLWVTVPNRRAFSLAISDVDISGAGAQARFLYDDSTRLGYFYVLKLSVAVEATMVIGAGAEVTIGDPLGSTIAGVVRGSGELSALNGNSVALLSGARVLVSANLSEADVSGRVVAGLAGQPFTIAKLELNQGRLVLTGGDITGQIAGQGQVVNLGVAHLFDYSPSGAVDDDVTVVNDQELHIGGYSAQNAIALSPQGRIVNNAGARMYWESEGVFSVSGGTIVNEGSIEMRSMAAPPDAPAYGTADISALVQNDGEIASGAGIEFENAVEGAGTDVITEVDSKGALLTGVQGRGFIFDGAVGAGQSVVFTGADQTLTLADISTFAANVQGFDANGGGDVVSVDTSVWTFAGFSENADGLAGVLHFSDGGVDAGVTLTGNYAASGFQGAVSGHTTTITYTPPA